jgi:hypothetical protein
MNQNFLIEEIDVVVGCTESDFHTTINTTWISLKNYAGCLLVLTKPAGSAGDDLVLALQQATDTLGTGAKALNISRFYAKSGTLSSSQTVKTFTRYDLVTAAATVDLSSVTANTFVGDGKPTLVTASDLAFEAVELCLCIDIRADDLDVSNAFNCINYQNLATHVANALLTNVLFIPYGARFPGQIPLSSVS